MLPRRRRKKKAEKISSLLHATNQLTSLYATPVSVLTRVTTSRTHFLNMSLIAGFVKKASLGWLAAAPGVALT